MKLLFNARIYTLDKSLPLASAILVDRERILAVGGRDELLRLAHGKVEAEHQRGRTIWPGLTDAHLHIQNYALSLQRIDCETDTKEESLRRVAERVKKAKPAGWNQNSWGTWPSAEDLGGISPNNPVYLTAKSLHAAWVNTAALRLAKITSDTTQSQRWGNPTR